MSDPLYDLLVKHIPQIDRKTSSTPDVSKYLARLLALRLSDLNDTEPQSLTQANHSNIVSLQALSSRSHRTTTISADHLSTLKTSLPLISRLSKDVKDAVPPLDESAVKFASTYSKSKEENMVLMKRKDSMLLARQADKLQDILELPSLLSAAIASAGSGTAGSANYSQALDLFAHIKRLQILYPDSQLIKSVLIEAEEAMKDMTTNLIMSLRGQNIRLAAAIRTIGWLRRVAPQLSNIKEVQGAKTSLHNFSEQQDEGSFGALFLCARLCTFLTMTEALAPLRDLADQETDIRTSNAQNTIPNARRTSAAPSHGVQGQQTERYLKRYIEIFREQSFSTISMFKNIFPPSKSSESDPLELPSALASFPLHLVEIFMETLQTYLPNITDLNARESLLMQVLYAANSLGRLGTDFSMMIALLNMTNDSSVASIAAKPETVKEEEDAELSTDTAVEEQEWERVIKKHRVQAARLDALATGQESAAPRRDSQNISVR